LLANGEETDAKRCVSLSVATTRDGKVLILHAPNVPGTSSAAHAIHSAQGIRRERMNTRLRCSPCATRDGRKTEQTSISP
jgi:hypothetical protein